MPEPLAGDRVPWARAALMAFALLLGSGPALAQIEILTEDRTYFVRSDGNNTNDCLTDAADDPNTNVGACATWQAAYDKVLHDIDFNNFTVTIKAGSGAHTWTMASGVNAMHMSVAWRGGGNLIFEGNVSNPANAVINVSGGAHCFRFDGVFTGVATVRGFTLNCPGGYGIRNGARGDVFFANIVFGAAYQHIGTEKRESYIRSSGAYTINGNADRHVDCDAGFIYIRNQVTINGSRTFSTFARARNAGYLLTEPNIWIVQGSVVGQRYQVYEHATISTQSENENHFPGNAAGNSYPQYGGLYL